MQHLIHLLPDSLANQIAAGEVVQRPASVVKELLENGIDAAATRVEVLIKQAGKTLIQVSDNGCGMSAQDARMCFERHATSKIREQDDLFNIRTLGFRGEALASIAAVAQVRLLTRLHQEELGSCLDIEASSIKSQSPEACPAGSTFQVKNLFFNVPARRNFLKSNPVETRHIVNEFIRVALANSGIHFSLRHNETIVYELPPADLQGRIIALFGSELHGKLTQVEESTGYVHISGFLGQAEIYRKSRGEQFFFVNGRYIRSPYLHHAIATAYQDFIPKEMHPFYCIFLEIDPVHVDINIHPTKTEVKFDDERTLYVLLQGMVKRSLGELHQLSGWEMDDPALKKAIYQSAPPKPKESRQGKFVPPKVPRQSGLRPEHWEKLYHPENQYDKPDEIKPLFKKKSSPSPSRLETDALLVALDEGLILTRWQNELYIIDQHLAHQRILYERFLRTRQAETLPSQQLLFPQTVAVSPADQVLLQEVEGHLTQMGFEIKDFGKDTLIVYGTPAGVSTGKVRETLEQILHDLKQSGGTRVGEKIVEKIAKAVAQRSAVTSQQKLSIIEMRNMVENLFRCEVAAFAPNGKPTYKALSMQELLAHFR